MTIARSLTSALLLVFGLALTGCDKGPDAEATKAVLQERLGVALKPPVTNVESFRRVGSGPLPATADGKARRIVYYNAVLTLNQDVNFASWNGLNASAFAALLGATDKGITGIKQNGNKSGDQLHVHGTATFVDENGTWQPVPFRPFRRQPAGAATVQVCLSAAPASASAGQPRAGPPRSAGGIAPGFRHRPRRAGGG